MRPIAAARRFVHLAHVGASKLEELVHEAHPVETAIHAVHLKVPIAAAHHRVAQHDESASLMADALIGFGDCFGLLGELKGPAAREALLERTVQLRELLERIDRELASVYRADAGPVTLRRGGLSFRGELVPLIGSGMKDQTRRLLTPQPPSEAEVVARGGQLGVYSHPGEDHWQISGSVLAVRELMDLAQPPTWRSPFGLPGDLLYVKQTWGRLHGRVIYREDHRSVAGHELDGNRWMGGRFMPRAVARHWLLVHDVRVTRLCKLTRADALAEGVQEYDDGWGVDGETLGDDPIAAFRALWDRLHPERPFASDPLVWAVKFQRFNSYELALFDALLH